MAPSRSYRIAMFFLTASCLVLLSERSSEAQDAPDSLSFQGFVTDPGGTPLNTTTSMTFKLYRDGSPAWMETQPSVSVTDGIFNVLLGSVTPLDTVAFDQPMEIGVTVGGDPEISPRTPLAAAPFALGMRGLYAVWAENPDLKSYNIIAGAPSNMVESGAIGALIAGGGGEFFGSPGGNIVGAQGHFSNILGGSHNEVVADFSTIGGGFDNTASGSLNVIAGGSENSTSDFTSAVGGGWKNRAHGESAVVGGGESNQADGKWSTVPGGFDNHVTGEASLAAGYFARAIHRGVFVWSDATPETFEDAFESTADHQFLVRATGGVGIGTNTPSNELTVDGDADVTGNLGIGTGTPPAKLTIAAPHNTITGPMMTFTGTEDNQPESGRIRFVDAGEDSFRGGYIHYDGVRNKLFLGTHPTDDMIAANDREVLTIKDSIFVGINNSDPFYPLIVGTDVTNGNNAHVTIDGNWVNTSSRALKEGFREIDKEALLNRLAALPVTEWRYKGNDDVLHVGPTAEDFREAFGLGHDDRFITTVDADGVALAAIQALYERVLALEAELKAVREGR